MAEIEPQAMKAWPFPRSRTIDAVLLVHVIRAVILFISAAMFPAVGFVTVTLSLVELFVGFWFWKQRLESWGVAFGLAVSHLLFPWAFYIITEIFILLIVASVIQCALQLLIRLEGHYSFVSISQVQPERSTDPTTLQSIFFNLTIMAQLLKAMFLALNGYLIFLAIGPTEPIPWLEPIPVVPTIAILMLIEVIVALAVFQGREWAFHLMLVLATFSIVEFLLSFSIFVFMLGMWIITLLAPCLAKDGFYSKFMKRREKVVRA